MIFVTIQTVKIGDIMYKMVLRNIPLQTANESLIFPGYRRENIWKSLIDLHEINCQRQGARRFTTYFNK